MLWHLDSTGGRAPEKLEFGVELDADIVATTSSIYSRVKTECELAIISLFGATNQTHSLQLNDKK